VEDFFVDNIILKVSAVRTNITIAIGLPVGGFIWTSHPNFEPTPPATVIDPPFILEDVGRIAFRAFSAFHYLTPLKPMVNRFALLKQEDAAQQ